MRGRAAFDHPRLPILRRTHIILQIGFLGPAFFLTQLSHVTTPLAAVACMMASQGLDAFSQSGLYSNHQVPKPLPTLPGSAGAAWHNLPCRDDQK